MLVEGKGWVAPSPLKYHITDGELAHLKSIADERAAFRRYDLRRDAWGRGFNRDAVLVGFIGEHAFAQYLNRSFERSQLEAAIDTRLLTLGDRGLDFDVFGMRLQVKTRREKFDSSFVRRVDDRKTIRPIEWDAFVAVSCNEATRVASLLGWCYADDARKHGRVERSPVGQHCNLVVGDPHLSPMSRLKESLRLRLTGAS